VHRGMRGHFFSRIGFLRSRRRRLLRGKVLRRGYRGRGLFLKLYPVLF
jgi:hypothetical protein